MCHQVVVWLILFLQVLKLRFNEKMEENGMLKGKVNVVVDLGNSETRVYVLYGGKKAAFSLSNRFYELREDYVIPEEYNESNTNVFSIGGISRVATGTLVEREFAMVSMRPTALDKKYNSLISKLSMNYVLFIAHRYLMEAYNKTIDEIDVTFHVTALLPPSDIDFGAKILSETIKGIKEINFEMPKLSKEVVVESVRVLPEGFCAYIGVLMSSGLKIRESQAHLVGATTLVIDIGAGTTDFCIIKENKVIEDTRDSFEIGGNNISQRVRKRLKQEGLSYPDYIIQEAIQTGFVMDGARKRDISEIVEGVKEGVAANIINEIQSFFEASQYPVRSIEYLLVCGGGTLEPENVEMKALSSYLVKYMKNLSANIELIQLPKVKTENGMVTVSPRRLNIMGATVLTEGKQGE